jgi:POT family proton-dependent oligopeptide transporter
VESQFERAIAKLPADWRNAPQPVTLPGYDGVTGTADDFVARCPDGHLESVEIPGRAAFLAAADRIESAAAGALPSNAEGNRLISGMHDSFGNPIRYELVDSANARLDSAGPDRKAKTEWDIGLTIGMPAAEAPADPSSWLARRKAELGIREKPVEAGFTRTEFAGGLSKLEGASYFAFFTWLISGTVVVFIPFAWFYRPKTYLHEPSESEPLKDVAFD